MFLNKIKRICLDIIKGFEILLIEIPSYFYHLYFCHHEWKFDRNIYGDEIIWCGYHRSWWKCDKCGIFKGRDYLVKE